MNRCPVALGVLAASFAFAAPARAGDPIMPLSQVQSGMHCTGYSVIHGTDISSFNVDVLAVTEDGILINASGPAVDATGIGEGFSGSPIYCKDGQGVSRNIGAIAFGIGDYGNHKAIATPIEWMLAEPVKAPAARAKIAGVGRLRPLRTPLTISGVTAPIARRLEAAGRRAGRAVVIAPRVSAVSFPEQTLRPGASLSVGLSTGDIELSAIGTVTYTDGPNVWGFGHPLDEAGARALLLQDAYVYDVIGNPSGVEGSTTYKYATPGHDLGTLSNDTLNAVVGSVGRLPRLIPLRSHVTDLDTGTSKTVSVGVTDELGLGLPASLEMIAPIAVGDAGFSVLQSSPANQSGRLCFSIKIRERKAPLGFCNRYAGAALDSMSNDATQAVGLVDKFKVRHFQHLRVQRVEASESVSRGLDQGIIVAASAPAQVRRGQQISVRLRLRRPSGAVRALTLRFRVPSSLPRGRTLMTLRGTPADSEPDNAFFLGGVAGAATSSRPRTIKQLAARIAAIHRFHGVTITFQPPGKHARARSARVTPATKDPLLRVSGGLSRSVRVR